ncbi:unnamed protein product [Boreogadus saida]
MNAVKKASIRTGQQLRPGFREPGSDTGCDVCCITAPAPPVAMATQTTHVQRPPCIQTAPSPQRTPHSKKTPFPQTTSPRAVHPHSHTLEPPAQAPHAPYWPYPTSHLLPGCEQGRNIPSPRP